MHSPAFLKQLNLRTVADYAQKIGQPLVLSPADIEIFPPVNPPLPFLPAIEDGPAGWRFNGAFHLVSGADPSLYGSLSWAEARELFAAHPDEGYAITNKFVHQGEETFVVSRFVRVS